MIWSANSAAFITADGFTKAGATGDEADRSGREMVDRKNGIESSKSARFGGGSRGGLACDCVLDRFREVPRSTSGMRSAAMRVDKGATLRPKGPTSTALFQPRVPWSDPSKFIYADGERACPCTILHFTDPRA